MGKIFGIVKNIKIPGDAFNQLQVAIAHVFVLHNFIGRILRVNHLKVGIMTGNRRAAQLFQNSDLQFLRPDGQKFVKIGGKSFQRGMRNAGDQVGMNDGAGFLADKTQDFKGALFVLFA